MANKDRAHKDRANKEKQANGSKPKMKLKVYNEELHKLQTELCKLQDWVKHKGLRIIVVFEGRDAAGKGGIIKAIMERASPRVFRTVALAPRTARSPSSTFNATCSIFRLRANSSSSIGVGTTVPAWNASWGSAPRKSIGASSSSARWSRTIVWEAGIKLVKFWLEVGREEQARRFKARIDDPLRQWKLSPMDVESWTRWYDYSHARDEMIKATDTEYAPWYIVHSDDK